MSAIFFPLTSFPRKRESMCLFAATIRMDSRLRGNDETKSGKR